MGCNFWGGGLIKRDRKGHGGGGVKMSILGDVLNGCSLILSCLSLGLHNILYFRLKHKQTERRIIQAL